MLTRLFSLRPSVTPRAPVRYMSAASAVKPLVAAELAKPLKIDVQAVAQYFPAYSLISTYSKGHVTLESESICNEHVLDKFTVLGFRDHSDGGYQTVVSSYPPKELAVLMNRLSNTLFTTLASALKGTLLELPMLKYDDEEEEIESRLKRCEKLAILQGPLKQANRNVDFLPREAAFVSRNKFSVTTANATMPILAASVTDSDVILVLYDSKNKVAVLGHVGPFTSIESLTKICDQVSAKYTIAHLVGGAKQSRELCLDIMNFLEFEEIEVIENADVSGCTDGIGTKSVAIDARTGVLYSPVSREQCTTLDIPSSASDELPSYTPVTPIMQSYNGRYMKSPDQVEGAETAKNKGEVSYFWRLAQNMQLALPARESNQNEISEDVDNNLVNDERYAATFSARK